MINSPFNYTGSKFKLLDQLLPSFDYSKPYFIDLFCGGGSVYSNILDKYEKVIVNDIISDLVNIHQSILESDDIIDRTKILCLGIKEDQDKFLKLREDYNNNPTSDKLWSLMLSCNSNLIRFNKKGKFNQTWGKRSWNDSTQKKLDIFKNHIRRYKDNIRFTSKSFKSVEVKSDKVMVYIDPPYSNTNAGYNTIWTKDDDEELYKYIKNIDKIGASFMLSGVLEHDGKPCKLLERLIIDGYRVIEFDFNYNKVSKKGKKNTKEIIIVNY